MSGAPLVPEGLPWLAHTAWWPRFTRAERLRANQLMGLTVNELFIALERWLIGIGVAAARVDGAAAARVEALRVDEARHAAMFAAFNRAFAPELYGGDGLRFVRAGAPALASARAIARAPGAWRVAAWAALAIEDWSCAFADALVRAPHGELGPRDAGYAALHAAHRADELLHVAHGVALVAEAGAGVGRRRRRLAIALASRLLRAALRPRRAAPRMIDRFVEDFPRWRADRRALARAVVAVGGDAAYWRATAAHAPLTATRRCARAWGGGELEAFGG